MTLGTSTFCLVRLYKNSAGTGAYIDLDNIQGPKLKFVENYGVTGSLTIVNDIGSSASNLLSSSCTLWSSGSGALKPGMFLHIWTGSRTNANKLGVFIITQISPSDDLIDVTFGDCIQILRATGADYFRNHYTGAQQHNNENTYGGWDSSSGRLYLEKPEGVTIDAANGDVQWAINSSLDIHDEALFGTTFTGNLNDAYMQFEFTLDMEWLYSFTFIRESALNCRFRIYVGGSLIGSHTYDESGFSGTDVERTIEFNTPVYVRNRTIEIEIDNIDNSTGADVTTANYTNSTVTYANLLRSGEAASGSEDGIMLYAAFEGVSEYVYATSGESDPDDDTIYYITGIEGVSSIDSSYGTPAFDGRARITYLVTEGGMLMSEVFEAICEAAGIDATVITSTREVGIMRCGGDYFHNYLLALADMEEPSGTYAGRQHAFMASRTEWGSIKMGYRHKASDTSAGTIYYAGDGDRSGEPMMAFTPTMTMQYRPYLAVTRGTKDDGTPIIIAMRDPDVDVGSATSLVDGSITEVEDAALSSYAEIITNRSKDWEGQVQLSGIFLDFFDDGTYVGGAPIRIYDSRYGMSGYQARVKEVQLDFTNQTTTLVLNNYSETYSNSIVDSTKMAYSAGSLAVEASSSDLFTLQYIRLESSATLSSRSSHTIEIYSPETGYVSAAADVLQVLDLDIAVLSAYFKRGVGTVTSQYAITRVRVDGSTLINIDSSRRPDKYSNQALIVNVQMNL